MTAYTIRFFLVRSVRFKRVVLLQSHPDTHSDYLQTAYNTNDIRVVKSLWKEDIVGHIVDFLSVCMESVPVPVHGLK